MPFKLVPGGLRRLGLDYYEPSTGGGSPSTEIGVPIDGTYDDGLLSFSPTTKIADATDMINETLLYLAPEAPVSLDSKSLDVVGTVFYTGKLSQGNTNYKIGTPAGSVVSYIIKDGTFIVNSSDQLNSFDKADSGSIEYYLNDSLADSVDLGTNFNEADRNTSQSSVPWVGLNGDLSVESVEKYNNFPLWQKGNASVVVISSDLVQGYNSIYLKRTGIDSDQTSQVLDLFFDTDSGSTPSVSIPTISENIGLFKYLSGVKYYKDGSTFNLSFVGSDLFNNVYHSVSPIIFSSTNNVFGSENIAELDSSVSGLSNPPVIGETMTVTNKSVTVPNQNIRSIDARIIITPRDPYGSYTAQQSISQNIMVDAYSQTSDALNEYFDDEMYRLQSGSYDTVPGSITGQWNSSTILSNGQAQVYNGSLVYPQLNFTTMLPSGNPDYSSFSSEQTYYRAFYKNNSPYSAGTLNFGNLSISDIDPVGTGDINVEIKLPGETGWLDLGTPYSAATFTGIDGDGCRVSVSGSQWNWTCGTFSTANSGYMTIVKVTIRNSAKIISQIQELGW